MLSRRDFGKMITAAVVLPSAGMAEPLEEDKDRVGLQGPQGPQFSVMMWTLSKRGSFDENLERVAEAGYRHVELVSEYKGWSGEDQRRILAHMEALGISIDAMAGMRLGFADPSGGDAYLSELKSLILIAQRLRCGQIILMSGKRIEGVPAQRQHEASIETLKRAAEVLHGAGLAGVIEPIDRLENPSIYLDGVGEGFEINRAVGSPDIKVLYDLYHEQRGFGNLIEKLDKNIGEVGLIHVADVPGRREPGTGEVNYGNIYKRLAQMKYTGMVAMEFYPTGDVVETLRRAREEVMGS
jgi:hydroxypyruvate isomerase